MENEPWRIERFHEDSRHPKIPKAKRAGGRRKQALKMAAHFNRSGLVGLANKLKTCVAGDRCGSGACPNCIAATARFLSERIQTTFAASIEPLMVSIVPSDEDLLASNIGELGIEDLHKNLCEGLADAGLACLPVIGGFDVSFNQYTGSLTRDSWFGHWCLFAADCDRKSLLASLKPSFPRSMLVPKPIKISPITHTPHIAHWYGFANCFDEKRYVISSAARLTKSKKISMRHPEFNSLMQWLDGIGLMPRIFTQGV